MQAKKIELFRLKNAMQSAPDFQSLVFKQSLPSLVRVYPIDAGPLRFLEEAQLSRLAMDSDFQVLAKGDHAELPHGGYLFYGSLHPEAGYHRYQFYKYVLPTAPHERLLAFEQTHLLTFRARPVVEDTIFHEMYGQFDVNASQANQESLLLSNPSRRELDDISVNHELHALRRHSAPLN